MKFPFGFRSTSAVRNLALAAGVTGIIVAAGGCKSSSSSPSHGTISAAPDAVAVNVYRGPGTTMSSACSGTLLSPHVVLTAAHCADNADAIRVKAPNSTNQESEVERIVFYDWGQEADHAHEHDLALLVLRTTITAPAFGMVDDNAAFRVPVKIDGRYTDVPNHTAAVQSDTITVDGTAPDGRPYTVAVKGTAQGAIAGGAVRRDNGSVLGIYTGGGTITQAGYFARLDDANIQIWLRFNLADQNETLTVAPGSGGTLGVGSLSYPEKEVLRNTGGGGGGGGGSDPSAGSNTGGSENDDPSQQPGEDTDDGSADDGSGDDGEGRPKDVNKSPDPKLGGGSKTAEVKKGSNYYSAFEPGDKAAAGDPDKNYADKHPDAAEIGSHGEPGKLVNAPSQDDLKAITMGKNAVVTAACYAGATPKGGGQSTAAKIAEESGISPDNVYGCTGTMSLPTSGDSANCKGQWVTGSGKPVPQAAKTKYGLKP